MSWVLAHPVIGPAAAAVKRRLPAPLLGALRQLRARAHHVAAWPPGRSLTHTLPSGVCLRLGGISDWVLFNEIFVDREYERALDALDRAAPDTAWVLDLGANVGYFSLRLADRLLDPGSRCGDFRVVAVEGSPRTFRRLSAHLGQPLLRSRCTAHRGLVGRRDGMGYITVSADHGMNSIVARPSLSRARMAFLDVETLVPPDVRIALLKCDIEGAEQMFLDSYGSLLRRVDAAVFEFHHALVDVNGCRRRLACAGLDVGTVLREYEGASVEMFVRESAARRGRAAGEAG